MVIFMSNKITKSAQINKRTLPFQHMFLQYILWTPEMSYCNGVLRGIIDLLTL